MLDYKKINVGIIDLGINNIFSILQLFKDLNCTTEIYNKKDKKKYNLIVLPGVGSFNEAMKIIKREKLDKDIIELSKDKSKIILGICLGMQLFFDQSNEFVKTKGLSLIKGSVKKLSNKVNVKTHIGWKKIYAKQKVFNNLDPYPAAILVGPEGGFSKKESEFMDNLSFVKKVSLGKQILRAETAMVAAVSIWQSYFGKWIND